MTPHADRAVLSDIPSDDDGLNARRAAILEAVVTEYIGTAEPVGSSHVAAAPGVRVSSATVRSEMVALERDGYLVQPHTSAGRIPTDKGYRFFVDTLGAPGTLGPVQRQEVRRFFAHVHGAVEDLLGHTSGLLANLTDYAAVVVGPTHDTATVRSLQLVDLGPNLALLVVVLSDGAVEKRAIELTPDIDDAVLAAAAAHMTAHIRGRTLADPGPIPDRGDPAFDTAVRLGRYFGNSAQFWLDLQGQYDIAVVERERGGEITQRVRQVGERNYSVGLDSRLRDNAGEIRHRRSDTLVGTLRETYGADFAKGYRSNAKLGAVLKREKADNLSSLIKRTRIGRR